MKRKKEDKTRERRIDMEVVVDAYDEAERAMGWYYYLDEKLTFPFRARCVRKRLISPLSNGERLHQALGYKTPAEIYFKAA